MSTSKPARREALNCHHEEAVKLRNELCRVFKERAAAQGLTGKKRDAAAMEFICGALATLVALYGEASPQAQYLTGLAFLVSVRGYSAIESVLT